MPVTFCDRSLRLSNQHEESNDRFLFERGTALKLAAAAAVFLALLLLPMPESLGRPGQIALAVVALVVVLWVTEIFPIAVSGLVGVVLLALLGGVPRLWRFPVRILPAGGLLPARHPHAGPGGAAVRTGRADGDLPDSRRRRQSRHAVRPDALFLRGAHVRPSLGQHAGRHHGARVRARDGALEHPQVSSLQPGRDAGHGFAQPAGVHGAAGGRRHASRGVRAAGRLLLDAVVHTDERPLLCLPRAGRRHHLPGLPRPGSGWSIYRALRTSTPAD